MGTAGAKNTEDWFLKNGGLLLQKLISSFNGKSNPIRSYSLQEIEQATDNYATSLLFNKWMYSDWYKGSLHGRPISVRKFHDTAAVDDLLEIVVKEIAFSSRMSTHNNVLKLLGCCLETRIPVLVHEYPADGAEAPLRLSDVVIHCPRRQCLPWKSRLRVAWDIANVIAYLHTAFPRPIIHRNVMLSSFFFFFLPDQDGGNGATGVPKLANFFLSIAVPKGEEEVVDVVRGSVGFIAPEYMMRGRFAEKVDVYGFGKLLLELLTGKKIVELGRLAYEEGFLLPDYVKAHVGNREFEGFVDAGIVPEQLGGEIHEEQQMVAVASLALRCIVDRPENRPTMVEVGKEIRQIQRMMPTS